MKAKEIKEFTKAELEQKYIDFKDELFNLKFQLATGQLENTARIPSLKKDIARVLTVMNEKALAENPRPKKLNRAKRKARTLVAQADQA
jgi:large subunit ribosomal protein L29